MAKTNPTAILTSFNRNFKARNDGNLRTMNFLASPEIVTAMAFSGDLNFNPTTDTIDTPSGPFRFTPPSGDRLPPTGYTPGDLSYAPSPGPRPEPETEIAIAPTSGRLEILEPFESNIKGGKGELEELTCLMRVRGKCTTDHISAAGPWLKVCRLFVLAGGVAPAVCISTGCFCSMMVSKADYTVQGPPFQYFRKHLDDRCQR